MKSILMVLSIPLQLVYSYTCKIYDGTRYKYFHLLGFFYYFFFVLATPYPVEPFSIEGQFPIFFFFCCLYFQGKPSMHCVPHCFWQRFLLCNLIIPKNELGKMFFLLWSFFFCSSLEIFCLSNFWFYLYTEANKTNILRCSMVNCFDIAGWFHCLNLIFVGYDFQFNFFIVLSEINKKKQEYFFYFERYKVHYLDSSFYPGVCIHAQTTILCTIIIIVC